ncbi:MAG TPA: hypothetical protein VJ777_03240 [Mycobacterium sp.]|nr:hypothetical protein [Mycobacterium sp.]
MPQTPVQELEPRQPPRTRWRLALRPVPEGLEHPVASGLLAAELLAAPTESAAWLDRRRPEWRRPEEVAQRRRHRS